MTSSPTMDVPSPPPADPWTWKDLGDPALVLAVFTILNRWILPHARIPESAYSSFSYLSRSLICPESLIAIAVPALFLFVRWRRLRWTEIEGARPLRVFILVLAGIIAWSVSTYDFNPYFGRWHAADRLAVVAIAGLIAVHPAFTALFVPAAMIAIGQLAYPLGDLAWTDKELVLKLLGLFGAFLSVAAFRRPKSGVFIVLALAMVGSHYINAGWKKVMAGWLVHNRLENLFVSSCSSGWLAFWPEETVAKLTGWVGALDAPLRAATLLLELSPVIMIFHRRAALASLAGLVVLHAGIFASSGIGFWKWAVADVAFAALLVVRARSHGRDVFGDRIRGVAFFFALAVAFFAYRPPGLAWFDTELNNLFRIEVEGASGRIYPVGSDLLRPYDLAFSQNRHTYLVNRPVLVGTLGMTKQREIADAIKALNGPEGLPELEDRLGTNKFDLDRAAAFDEFMKRFFRFTNARGGNSSWIRWVAPPRHICFTAGPKAYAFQEPVRRVRVRYVVTLYRGKKLVTCRDELIRVIEVE